MCPRAWVLECWWYSSTYIAPVVFSLTPSSSNAFCRLAKSVFAVAVFCTHRHTDTHICRLPPPFGSVGLIAVASRHFRDARVCVWSYDYGHAWHEYVNTPPPPKLPPPSTDGSFGLVTSTIFVAAVPPPLLYVGWVGVVWQRHCKTCRSLVELDCKGTAFFV